MGRRIRRDSTKVATRWADVADLLLGAECLGCHGPGWGVCLRCRTRSGGCRFVVPDPSPPGFPRTVSSADYDQVMSNIVTAYKDRQGLAATGFLAERLAMSVATLLLACPMPYLVVLVPVPSAARAVRRRGFDATWTLARRTQKLLTGGLATGSGTTGSDTTFERWPVPAVTTRRLLTQRRSVLDQSGLTATQRQRNVTDRFALRAGLGAGAAAVVVDDVVTTGSSLTESARALRAGGVPVLGAATVAATRRYRHS